MMEVHIHRLEMAEKREEELREQLTEKTHQVTQLANRIAVSSMHVVLYTYPSKSQG